MNCEKVKESIEAFHDGAINGASGILVEKHLTNCSSCAAELNRLRALRKLLQKDVAPVPSPALDRKLMRAFLEKHERPAKSPSWWSAIFAGSVSIPKPAFAAALIAVAVAITAANFIGRNAAISAGANTASTAPAVSLQPSPSTFIEQTKIVEVPVYKERVVTKTVYVERESGGAQKTSKKTSDFNTSKLTALDKNRHNTIDSAVPGLQMSASIAENGYFTRTDLKDFEPATESNVRIIRKEKTDEK